MNRSEKCIHPTTIEKLWPYEQYYTGEKDSRDRKSGEGDHHWTGAESLESYKGQFVRDTMHGVGEYRWRYKGPEGTFASYEGNFYGNSMHGYGTMSYDDGRIFTGLYHHNVRWGPGIETFACLREDVGLWRGNQLLRLTWRPAAPNLALDLGVSVSGRTFIEPLRKLLVARKEKLGKVNSALDLLKQCGTKPMKATENWQKLYPKHCNDFASKLCNVELFDIEYYDKKIQYLDEVTSTPAVAEDTSDDNTDTTSENEPSTYYAWNNNNPYIHMMKHCYKHDKQRKKFQIELAKVLNGPRNEFKPPGKHELDCRVLLMSSFLGDIVNVAEMVNECNVHPDVTDVQGNNAIMYAACGDRPDIIHFLKEAGTTVDAFNDNCCTPLGLALIRYLCTRRDITYSSMVEALIPPPLPAQAQTPLTSPNEKPSEWLISRDPPPTTTTNTMGIGKPPRPAKGKSLSSIGITKKSYTNIENQPLLVVTENEQSLEDKRTFINVNGEFLYRVNDLFSIRTAHYPVPYLFDVTDMVSKLLLYLDENKKGAVVNKKEEHKVIKASTSSKDEYRAASKDEFRAEDSTEKFKQEVLSQIMSTILQLMSDGADPCLVRCPQSAMLMAVTSNNATLVERFVERGADVNEVYPHLLDYTPLDVALSQLPTAETLELVRTLLKCGAKTDHRLKYDDPDVLEPTEPKSLGPNLLHVVLAKECSTNEEEDICNQMLELLLQYNCDPTQMFEGSSAIDMTMNKRMDILDIFIKSSKTDLNAIINESNQTMLTKMFWLPFCWHIPPHQRLLTLTNLLLYGADPLLGCQNNGDKYDNVFVFARKTLTSMDPAVIGVAKSEAAGGAKAATKKPDKGKKDEKQKLSGKQMSTPKLNFDEMIGDYKQTLDLAVGCARILLVRWLQTKLYNQLMDVVVTYKHRQWNMIHPEHKNKKPCALWLTSARCIEIWDILKAKKKKNVYDRRVLRHMLCIVQLYCVRGGDSGSFLSRKVTAEEKKAVETEVNHILHEHRMAQSEAVPCSRPYVLPELSVGSEEKYNVCFECLLPFQVVNDELMKIPCQYCKLISFCSHECMKMNVDRAGCHPCSERLRAKYFPTPPEESVTSLVIPSNSPVNRSAVKQKKA